jgi:hypothetical protein
MTVLRFGTDTGRVSQRNGRDTPRWSKASTESDTRRCAELDLVRGE